MIKGSILQEDITIFIMYVPNNALSNYKNQELSKKNRKTHHHYWKLQPSSIRNGQIQQAENHNRIQEHNQSPGCNRYIYRRLHPITAKYTFFSSSYGTFTKTGHIMHHEKANGLNLE